MPTALSWPRWGCQRLPFIPSTPRATISNLPDFSYEDLGNDYTVQKETLDETLENIYVNKNDHFSLKKQCIFICSKTTTTSNAEKQKALCAQCQQRQPQVSSLGSGCTHSLSVTPSGHMDTQRPRSTGRGPSTSPPVRKACAASSWNVRIGKKSSWKRLTTEVEFYSLSRIWDGGEGGGEKSISHGESKGEGASLEVRHPGK